VLFVYITRLASNEIFSPSNKIHWEVGRAKDLSAPRYAPHLTQSISSSGFDSPPTVSVEQSVLRSLYYAVCLKLLLLALC
jgi:hypothetical protein